MVLCLDGFDSRKEDYGIAKETEIMVLLYNRLTVDLHGYPLRMILAMAETNFANVTA